MEEEKQEQENQENQENQEKQEKQETIIDAPGKIPKYAVVLRFWSTPEEIEVDDLILCIDNETNRYYYQIIDTQGRMWKNIPESDVIVIENLPTEKSIERFMEIKKQIIEMEKEKMVCKPKQVDVSVG